MMKVDTQRTRRQSSLVDIDLCIRFVSPQKIGICESGFFMECIEADGGVWPKLEAGDLSTENVGIESYQLP